MDLGIQGKKALVAGGRAGMGKSSALALAQEGVEVFISARGEERLNNTVSEIGEKTGASVTALVADHSTAEGRAKLAESCPDPDIMVVTISPPEIVFKYLEI